MYTIFNKLFQKARNNPDVMVDICNPSTFEVGEGGS